MQKTEQFEIDLHVDTFEKDAVDSEIQTSFYRIVQEQMTNILKHAAAGKVKINIRLTKKSIKLSISDNGKGFDPAVLKDGIGLENIKRRAEMFSGKCKLRSSPGNGCELMVELPLKTGSEKKPQKIPVTVALQP
jgi:signal transduction histidine kinase